jgi:hypothetical protein
MAGAAESLSFLSRRLIQFEGKFALRPKPGRAQAAQLFAGIAKSLHALYTALQEDEVPHVAARQLARWADVLSVEIAPEVGASEAERMGALMADASDHEKLFLEFRSSENPDSIIEDLWRGSVLVQALADGLDPTASVFST